MNNFVEKSKDTHWCPTAGCTAVFTTENNPSKYNCMNCNKAYCLECNTEDHPTMTC